MDIFSFRTLLIILTFNPILANAEIYKNGEDITSILNNQIQENKTINIPAGDFKIDAETSIILKDNVTVTMSPQTILNVIPNKSSSYQVFRIHNVKNVTITGGVIVGDKYTHKGVSGDWGMGVEIKDSQNIHISNMSIKKMWGDAIYIGSKGLYNNDNIYLENLKLDDNRRQGISIISAQNLYANKISISNTSGAAPGSGIDIEPNDNKAFLKNLNFKNIITKNNRGMGIQTTLKFYKESLNPISINIYNHKDFGSNFGFLVNGVDSKINGKITVLNTDYKKNKYSNLCFSKWENSKFTVNLEKMNNDKQLYIGQWCEDFRINKQIKFK
ncbi:right-handed parallel beta-helix repeat-containing protein [Acinetobacter sp. XS-4]|uniref:right-handed parallel beta-helix repeat-containing protein n=1 Tax=Acinetobacter sp. XS-4 TaxID=2923375 RepID=UPI00208ED755|nr:right-handed parallel beta-helix repeat-containing protein [Acinetobacter sp. XS-4]USP40454.1 right-handed parallel beta-helix repeat-containing protein [Acinetobacter sp. XS-4]